MLLAFNSLVFAPPWEGGIHSILIRDPVLLEHWIADQVRNDKSRARNDIPKARNDKSRAPDDKRISDCSSARGLLTQHALE